MTMPPVLDKPDFVRRYAAKEFGNGSPTWDTWEEFCEGTMCVPDNTLYHIRNRVAGGLTWYNVPKLRMFEAFCEATKLYTVDDLYVSEMCPTEQTTIQGEVLEASTGELQLYFSSVKKPMRQALLEGGRQVGNLAAKVLIERYMNPRSLDWLHWLLSAYPGHVIEFTCLSRCWGSIPGYNTLFWEVRRY